MQLGGDFGEIAGNITLELQKNNANYCNEIATILHLQQKLH